MMKLCPKSPSLVTWVVVGIARCESGPQSTRSQFWRENSGAPCVRLETGSLLCLAQTSGTAGWRKILCLPHSTHRIHRSGFRGFINVRFFSYARQYSHSDSREVCVKCNVCTLHTRLMPQCFTMNLCQRLSI